MTQQPVLLYDRIGQNRRNTFLLMAGFVALVACCAIAIGIVLGMPYPYAPLLIIPFLIFALLGYYSSSRITLAISQAHEVTKQEEPELFRTVENLCIGAGLPMPKLYVIEDGSPNAFATGRDPEHAVVCVTRGLLQKLDHLELEGVIAHELSHIGNYDIRIMTIVVVLVGLVALMADFMLRLTLWGAGGRRSNRGRSGGSAALIVYGVALVAIILTPIAAQLLRFSISRQREYLADASAALLTRYPEGLARALEKIAADPDPLEAANKATAHLYINNPLHEHKSLLNNLFSTHPPIQERIRLLRAM
ncbi:MAG: M48 family metallopeptidase [Candidatus Bathyarchaeota archaeon]|nr:M48 family metallopeptidase [Candidatus Bathyarchaeota archaeon]